MQLSRNGRDHGVPGEIASHVEIDLHNGIARNKVVRNQTVFAELCPA